MSPWSRYCTLRSRASHTSPASKCGKHGEGLQLWRNARKDFESTRHSTMDRDVSFRQAWRCVSEEMQGKSARRNDTSYRRFRWSIKTLLLRSAPFYLPCSDPNRYSHHTQLFHSSRFHDRSNLVPWRRTHSLAGFCFGWELSFDVNLGFNDFRVSWLIFDETDPSSMTV